VRKKQNAVPMKQNASWRALRYSVACGSVPRDQETSETLAAGACNLYQHERKTPRKAVKGELSAGFTDVADATNQIGGSENAW